MGALGWHGKGHGAPLRKLNIKTGATSVLTQEGEWVQERLPASDSAS